MNCERKPFLDTLRFLVLPVKKKRIFIAVDVSDEVKKEVAGYINLLINRFPNLRVNWEKTEKFHLTLKFLGNTDESLLEKLKEKIGQNAEIVENFWLRINGKGVFPNTRNPRVLWLGVEEQLGRLSRLQNLIEKSCAELGFETEKRDFKPHLTVARIRDPEKASELVRFHLEKNTEFKQGSFQVTEVVIYESLLFPEGSVYRVISKHQLR